MRTARLWPVLLAALLVPVGCSDPDTQRSDAPDKKAEQRADPDNERREPPERTDDPPPDRDKPVEPAGPARTGKQAESFGDEPVEHESDAKARLVDLDAESGEPVDGGRHTEKVTFTFDGTEVLPKYHVGYVDDVRSHPEAEPIDLTGNAFLQVGFELTNPNIQGRLAIPPDLRPGLPLTKEVLVVRNVGGTMRFAVGLDERAAFRTKTLESPTRLVVELREKR